MDKVGQLHVANTNAERITAFRGDATEMRSVCENLPLALERDVACQV